MDGRQTITAMQAAMAIRVTTSGEPITDKKRMIEVSSVEECAWTNRRTVSSN